MWGPVWGWEYSKVKTLDKSMGFGKVWQTVGYHLVVLQRLIQSSYKYRAGCGARMANLTDLKAKNIKPEDKNIPDGTVVGLRLIPGNELI